MSRKTVFLFGGGIIVLFVIGYLFQQAIINKEKLIGEVYLNKGGESNLIKSFPLKEEKNCSFDTSEAPLRANFIFSEIAWMGSLESPNDEWIELANIDSELIDVSGWQIVDVDEQIKIVLRQNTIIPANGFFLLKRGENRLNNIRADFVYSGNLKNSQEGLRLFNQNCRLMDEVLAQPNWLAGDNKSKRTMERNLKNLSWYTSAVVGGTPKKENSSILSLMPKKTGELVQTTSTAAPTALISTSAPVSTSALISTSSATTTEIATSSNPVVIPVAPPPPPPPPNAPPRILFSEIMAGIEGNLNYEFIELYNAGASAADLTGWSIKKRSSTGSISSLVVASRLEGKIIQPQKYFLLVNGGGYNGTVAADVIWPSSYALAYKNNALILYNAEGNIADEISWSEIPVGQSYRRVSWDSNNFVIEPSPNPQNSL